MTETAMFILAALGFLITWTTTTVVVVVWLTSRFRRLEVIVYKGLHEHRRYVDRQLHRHDTRIQRIELHAFGFSPVNMEPPVNGNGNGGTTDSEHE